MIANVPSAEVQNQGRPEWVDENLMRETKTVWEPFYGRCLTEREVLAIVLNFGRLIDAI